MWYINIITGGYACALGTYIILQTIFKLYIQWKTLDPSVKLSIDYGKIWGTILLSLCVDQLSY